MVDELAGLKDKPAVSVVIITWHDTPAGYIPKALSELRKIPYVKDVQVVEESKLTC